MSLEKSLNLDNEESPAGVVRLLKQMSEPSDFNSSINNVQSGVVISRQSSSKSLGHSSTADSSFDSISPEPLSLESSEEQTSPIRNRIRRSETLPPIICRSEGDSAEIPNGNMATTGLDHGGGSSHLTSPERLAPALSYPCLFTATTSTSGNLSTTTTATSGLSNSLLSSSPNLAGATVEGTATTPSSLSSSSSSNNNSSSSETTEAIGPSPLAPAFSSSSPLNSSNSTGCCNGSMADHEMNPLVSSPSPIPGGHQRPSRSRSPSSPSPTRRNDESSSREASLEKASSSAAIAAAAGVIGVGISSGGDVSLDQISVEGGESGSAGSMRSFEHLPRNTPSGPESINGSKQGRSGGRKKSAWYQMLNPTYRSRCEDFKRIFKDLPVDERLIVDYSCALQRDILLQGRIYVTQNYLCFYANIFRWETLVQLRWKEVSSLTKEKTALVIPNAIQICTEADKHFFCSFGARDKTYVVLFRTWQQALLDQPLGNQELWKFVHSVYGTELGFSSNDEAGTSSSIVCGVSASAGEASPLSEINQVQPSISLQQLSSPSPSLHSAQTSNDDDSGNVLHQPISHNAIRNRHHHYSRRLQLPGDGTGSDWRESLGISSGASGGNSVAGVGGLVAVTERGGGPTGIILKDNMPSAGGGGGTGDADVPPPYSETTESEDERYMNDEAVQCPVLHEGREMVNMVMPMSVDELFTLLFTNSTFYIDFITTTRKCTDLDVSPWQEGETNPAEKFRKVAFTIPLSNNIGVKSTRAVESQTLLDVSRPGDFYAIDVEASNSGIPYAETFAVCCHWCLMRSGYRKSRLVIYSQIKYKKSVWGIVKTFIEKNAWAALEENFDQMKRSLLSMQSSRDAEDVRIERRAELPSSSGTGSGGAMGVGGPMSSGGPLKKRHHSRANRRRKEGMIDNGLMEKRSKESPRSSRSVKQSGTGAGGGSGSLGVVRHSKMAASSSSSSPTPSSSGSTPPGGCSAVFYVVLVSLVLLLCTNGFLFSKIWALEQLAEELARHPPSCLSAANMADLRVLTAQPKSPEEWMRILRQQETLYRSTESKWRSTLSAMSGYLKQTQESLTNLEREMEPDSDLIRAILEKIQPPASSSPSPVPPVKYHPPRSTPATDGDDPTDPPS
ncbi:protein Aster-B-like isoform X1 [Daphnia pulex]|uniref:protein Aster-B-like isoform X1 n=2 Tax=Daphnia pulex TaxID=6669 RepID=UPI001EDD7908|nr:protein Aster-B-like isoform X1 [Daphnia pulex]